MLRVIKLRDFRAQYILTLKKFLPGSLVKGKSAIPHSLEVVKNERKKNRVMSESLKGLKAVTGYNEWGGTATNGNGHLYILYYKPSSSSANDEFRVPVDFDTDSLPPPARRKNPAYLLNTCYTEIISKKGRFIKLF